VGPLVSSAIAIIVVTNYCIFRVLGMHGSPEQIFSAIWPMAVPATVTVVLVMSALYHLLEETFDQLEERRSELLARTERDLLTGVASRYLFNERLSQALQRFHRNKEKFAVIMLDLDYFKRVNDIHGNQSGDELLKQAAERLQSQVRGMDTVARFGGDE